MALCTWAPRRARCAARPPSLCALQKPSRKAESLAWRGWACVGRGPARASALLGRAPRLYALTHERLVNLLRVLYICSFARRLNFYSTHTLLTHLYDAGIAYAALTLLNSTYRCIRKHNGLGSGDALFVGALTLWFGIGFVWPILAIWAAALPCISALFQSILTPHRTPLQQPWLPAWVMATHLVLWQHPATLVT